MPDPAMLDYFYGDEAEQYIFYRIPKNSIRKPEIQTSEKQKSKVPQNGSQDFQKTATNNTERNKTELNDTAQLGAYQIRGGLLKVQYHQGTQYPFLSAHLPL